MKQYYFDNAATSSPKAPGVGEAMADFIHDSVNINRGTYGAANRVELSVLETRELLARFFGFSQKANQVIFTPGATFGLNMVLKGYLRPGDHVIVSSMEHNAVMRPLSALFENGVTFSRIPADARGVTDTRDIEPLICSGTRLMLISHASNVSGTIFPVEAAAEICERRGIPLVIDAAQTAGHMPINFDGLGIAALCVPGHKGLMGPQGVGAVLMDKAFAETLSPLVTGGTGSASDSEIQPRFLPDKFEAGTVNLPGIMGLRAAMLYMCGLDMRREREREIALTARFIEGIRGANVRIAGPADASMQVGVISVDFTGIDNAEAAYRLETEYGILTRCGLHCAPNAHGTLGTFPRGTVRFSIGHDTLYEDVDIAAEAVKAVAAV